jgi:hypothetical protein
MLLNSALPSFILYADKKSTIPEDSKIIETPNNMIKERKDQDKYISKTSHPDFIVIKSG